MTLFQIELIQTMIDAAQALVEAERSVEIAVGDVTGATTKKDTAIVDDCEAESGVRAEVEGTTEATDPTNDKQKASSSNVYGEARTIL